MTLITSAQRQQLLANGRAAQQARIEERDVDPHPIVKLFTPDANCTWLLTELDSTDSDRAFGLCDLGLGCPELGYVSLQEITDARGTLGLHVKRDIHFDADKPLSAYATEAREHGRIIT